jgi:CHAT domain-containing protein
VVTVARRLLGSAAAWRSIVETTARLGGPFPRSVSDPAFALLGELTAAGWHRAAGSAALLLADLFGRGGLDPAPALDLARTEYADDPAGLRACRLVELDAALPGGRPELLGEDLEGFPGPAPGPAEPGLAERYAELAAEFESAGSTRGVAAVALRRCRLALPTDPDAAVELLDRAAADASGSGDTALARLVEVHRALLHLELGGVVDTGAVAQPIIDWAGRDGSTSFARGLARLCAGRAERWRDDGIVRARRATLLAQAIAAGVGADAESPQARRERAARYGARLYGRVALRFTLRAMDDAFPPDGAAPSGLDLRDWVQLVDQVVGAHRDAVAVLDPDALLRIRDRLSWLLEHPPADPEFPAVVTTVEQALAEAVVESTVETPRYAGHAALDAGDLDLATSLYETALTNAEQAGSPTVSTAVALATLRRLDEAAGVVEAAWTNGTLPPDLAAPLFVLVGRFGRAREALALLPAEDERSWPEPELRARVALGEGTPDIALVDAGLAVRRFEDGLGRLSRDVLRTNALDSTQVATLYATVIRTHVAMAAGAAPDTAARHVGAAFVLSDRGRGMVLADLLHDMFAAAADEPATVAVAVTWERAGAELARVLEELAAAPEPADLTALQVAEGALDDAESAFVTRAPTLFAQRSRLPDPIALPDVQDLLGQRPGTLLIQYHVAGPHELLIFTVTADGAQVRTVAADTRLLGVNVRLFHRTVVDITSTPAQRVKLGTALADTLLAPVADEVTAHDRLVIVPHGPLAVLPFHVLPWAGDELGAGRVVSYLPAVAAVLRQRPAAVAGGAALIVGDPAYSPLGPRRLPGTGVEAHAIAALYGVDPLVGAAARRETVLGSLAAAPVVHLGTHGFLAEAAPYSSHLALAGTDRLTVPDLVGVHSRTELAVLSACDSGRGRATAAGDVIGLTRALLGAGVRGVVASLWPVNDIFACLIMIEFHRRLLAGDGPPAALAGASAALRALTPQAARARFAEHAVAHGLDHDGVPDVRTNRGIGGELPITPGTDPAHPNAYAPFFYAGAW